MKQLTIIKTDKPRPTHTPEGVEIPADWLIMVAPRPLYGSWVQGKRIFDLDGVIAGFTPSMCLVWEDWSDNGWISGRLYAALNPHPAEEWEKRGHRKLFEDNVSLEGAVVKWGVTDGEIQAWARGYYGPEIGAGEIDPYDKDVQESFRESFWHKQRVRKVDAEEYYKTWTGE